MAQTLTATTDPTYSPPRIRLDFTDTAASPVTSVTINRQDASGRVYPVRTSDDGPLPTSGGAASVYDYEPPYAQDLIYSTTITGGPTATANLAVSRPWLVHPGIPSRSMTFLQMAGSVQSETWDIDQGVFKVLMRSTPIVATGGVRFAPASTLLLGVSNPTDLAGLKQLLSDGAPLLLNVPGSLGWGIDTSYIAVGPVQNARPTQLLVEAWRTLSLPYQVVARPAGGTRGGLTWDGVDAKYGPWSDIPTGTTWAQLAAQSS